MSRQEIKAQAFRALHTGDAFLIPNPWDAGSARVLEALGFKALATTSSGFAFTLGRSVGGGLTWVAVKAMTDVAETMRDSGDSPALLLGHRRANGYRTEHIRCRLPSKT